MKPFTLLALVATLAMGAPAVQAEHHEQQLAQVVSTSSATLTGDVLTLQALDNAGQVDVIHAVSDCPGCDQSYVVHNAVADCPGCDQSYVVRGLVALAMLAFLAVLTRRIIINRQQHA